MYPELTNLLPDHLKHAFRQTYFVRLVTVGLVLLSGVIIAHGLLLVPSYLYASASAREQQAALNGLAASDQTSQEQAITGQLGTLRQNVTYLSTIGTLPTASASLRGVLAVPRPGITISGFTFTPPTQTPPTQGKLAVTGVAASRDSLRQYDSALSALPFVKSADLPISAYAQETDIPFTITLTGPMLP